MNKFDTTKFKMTYNMVQASELTGITTTTIKKAIDRGDLKAWTMGKGAIIKHDDLVDFLDNLELYGQKKPVEKQSRITPGPWYVREIKYFDHIGFTINTEGGEIEICDIYPKSQSHSEVKKANARLISAAPDLLEALEEALEVFEYNDHKVKVKTTVDKIKAVIARARGE